MAFKKPVKLGASRPENLVKGIELNFRRQERLGVDWGSVNTVSLKAALASVILSGNAIMLSSAAGGRGVCVKIFQGEHKAVEYATDAEELSQLLEQVIDQLGPTSEDIRAVMAMTT